MHFSDDKQKLLNDTLRNRRYEIFRAELFQAGLKVLRQKNPPRVWPRWLALAASIALLLGLALLSVRHRRKADSAEQSIPETFASIPLKKEDLVRSSKDEN